MMKKGAMRWSRTTVERVLEFDRGAGDESDFEERVERARDRKRIVFELLEGEVERARQIEACKEEG